MLIDNKKCEKDSSSNIKNNSEKLSSSSEYEGGLSQLYLQYRSLWLFRARGKRMS